MAHMQKYKKAAVSAMTNHYDRELEGTKKRENIDPARSGDNYVIYADKLTKGKEMKELTRRVRHCIEKAIEEHKETTGKQQRSDAVLMADWVVTAPKDCDQVDEFFECVVAFMKLRYGVENVIGGYVHNDETTPHIHIPVIPVVNGRLNAKAMLSRQDLRSFHQDLQEYVNDHGIQASVLLDDEDVADKLLSSIPQDKLDVFKDAIENEIEEQVDERVAKIAEALEIREKNLEFKYKRREAKLDSRESDLNTRKNALDARESDLNRSRSIFAIESEKALKELTDATNAYKSVVSTDTLALQVLGQIKYTDGSTGLDKYNFALRQQNVKLRQQAETAKKSVQQVRNTGKQRQMPPGMTTVEEMEQQGRKQFIDFEL